ncbi:MAG: hypothetical protein HY741_05150 [Chloroflexi bacterium]|nr:hypothetical protein [Chloroflexota bacterium]
MKPKQLQPRYGQIDGYGADTQAHKDQFLRDGRAYLKSVGEYLAVLIPGLQVELCVNKAGVAVSGEVFAYFSAPGGFRLFVQVGTSALRILSGRADGVIVLAQLRSPIAMKKYSSGRQAKPGVCYSIGANDWRDPNLPSDEMARQLFERYGGTLKTVHPLFAAKEEEDARARMVNALNGVSSAPRVTQGESVYA